MTHSDEVLAKRTRLILELALAGLDPADREDRIAWCRANDQHGVRMERDGDLHIFTWGGRVLAMVQQDVLLLDDDVPFGTTFVGEVPDDLSELS